MNMKCLAVAGALMLAVPVAASAATPLITDTVIANKAQGVPPGQRNSSVFSVVTAGLYDFMLSVGPNSGNSPTGSLTATLYKLAGQLSTSVSSIQLPVTNGSSSSATNQVSLGIGNYFIRWTGSVVGGPGANGTITGTASVAAVQAVPGPEAGAGLGALAIGGLALYMKRRRKDEVAAA